MQKLKYMGIKFKNAKFKKYKKMNCNGWLNRYEWNNFSNLFKTTM